MLVPCHITHARARMRQRRALGGRGERRRHLRHEPADHRRALQRRAQRLRLRRRVSRSLRGLLLAAPKAHLQLRGGHLQPVHVRLRRRQLLVSETTIFSCLAIRCVSRTSKARSAV